METPDTIPKEELVSTRPGTVQDENFIFATWLQGLRHSNDLFKLMPADVYYAAYHKVIESLLNAPGVQVRIACLKDTPDVILGYSVYRGDTLHWTHVKKAWRKIGIAKSLMPESGIKTITHINKLGVSYLFSHPSLVFNPFAIP